MGMQVFLQTREDRARAVELVKRATAGLVVEIREPKKTSKQNRYMHKLLERIAEAGITWGDRNWTALEWKNIAISGFDAMKRNETDPDDLPMITGWEGELCQIRRSWSDFGRTEAAEFLTYLIAFCDKHGVSTEIPR